MKSCLPLLSPNILKRDRNNLFWRKGTTATTRFYNILSELMYKYMTDVFREGN